MTGITDDMIEKATAVLNRAHTYLSTRNLAEEIVTTLLAGRVVLDLPAVKREDEDGRYYYVETPTGCVQGSPSRGGEGEQPPWFRVNNGKWLQVLGEREFAAAVVAVLRAAEVSGGVGGDPQ